MCVCVGGVGCQSIVFTKNTEEQGYFKGGCILPYILMTFPKSRIYSWIIIMIYLNRDIKILFTSKGFINFSLKSLRRPHKQHQCSISLTETLPKEVSIRRPEEVIINEPHTTKLALIIT